MMSSILKIDRKEIEEETSFGEYGFDSITFTRLGNEINQQYGTELLPSIFFECNSLAEMTDYVIEQYGEILFAETESFLQLTKKHCTARLRRNLMNVPLSLKIKLCKRKDI